MAEDQNWRIDHTGIGVSDISRSAHFYGSVLAEIGLQPLMHITSKKEPTEAATADLGGVAYGADYPIFWIDTFHPNDARHHTAFRARSRDEVQAFHAAALRAGGTDNGAPGLRSDGYPPGYYAAFVLDPDGNNIEAVFRES